MQKINKVFISLIIFSLVSLLIPFNISADDATYTTVPNGYTVFYVDTYYQPSNTSTHNTREFNLGTHASEVRALFFNGTPSNACAWYFISLDPFQYSLLENPQSFNSAAKVTYDNVDYYYFYNNLSRYSTSITDSNIAIVEASRSLENAVYYTFGEGAVASAPEFGQLKIGFESSIAYSGGNTNAWRQNKDTIYFDQYDTLGNDLFGYLIELQAIPYSVEGASQQNIFAQGINSYVFDTVKIGHLGYWSPGQNSIDFTWEYVTNRFSPTWWGTAYDNWSLYGWFQNEHWYRVGWAYRARLVDEEENVLIDWQWIYNGTSIDGPDVNNIINNNGLTPELVHSINNINNNNNTTNNNYYNNQVINYNSSDPETDGSWIEQLISSILQTLGDLIGKILDFFSSIFDGLVDLILGLFGDINPADSFFGWFSDLFDGIGEIDLTLPQFNIPNSDITSFNRLVQKTLDVFSFNNFGFVIFIPLLLIIIKAVF